MIVYILCFLMRAISGILKERFAPNVVKITAPSRRWIGVWLLAAGPPEHCLGYFFPPRLAWGEKISPSDRAGGNIGIRSRFSPHASIFIIRNTNTDDETLNLILNLMTLGWPRRGMSVLINLDCEL